MSACRPSRGAAWLVALLGIVGPGCGRDGADHPAVGRAIGTPPVVPLGRDAGPPELVGRVTLLNFWATWCPPCRRELPGLARLAARLATEPRFQLVAVNVDSGGDPETLATEIRDFLAARGIPLEAWAFADPVGRATLSATLGLEGIPATFLVGPDGRVRRAWVGFRAGDEAEMARAVLAVLQEKEQPSAARN